MSKDMTLQELKEIYNKNKILIANENEDKIKSMALDEYMSWLEEKIKEKTA